MFTVDNSLVCDIHDISCLCKKTPTIVVNMVNNTLYNMPLGASRTPMITYVCSCILLVISLCLTINLIGLYSKGLLGYVHIFNRRNQHSVDPADVGLINRAGHGRDDNIIPRRADAETATILNLYNQTYKDGVVNYSTCLLVSAMLTLIFIMASNNYHGLGEGTKEILYNNFYIITDEDYVNIMTPIKLTDDSYPIFGNTYFYHCIFPCIVFQYDPICLHYFNGSINYLTNTVGVCFGLMFAGLIYTIIFYCIILKQYHVPLAFDTRNNNRHNDHGFDTKIST